MTTIALIGFRGSGKTTVARCLAEMLEWGFLDADDQLQRRAVMTIAEIFECQGEASFRDLETDVVSDLVKRSNCVLALGGGAVLRETNRQAIQTCDHVIWLRASPPSIYQRLQNDPSTREQRPNLLAGGGMTEIQTLIEQRTPLYQQCSDHIIETDSKSPQQIAEEIRKVILPTVEGLQ